MDADIEYKPTSSFVRFLALVENGPLVTKWEKDSSYLAMPYWDKNKKASAFGHNWTAGEDFSAGVSKAQGYEILSQDVVKHWAAGQRKVDKKYGEGTWGGMSSTQQEALTDIEFNVRGGTTGTSRHHGYPKLTDAIVNGNQAEIVRQFRRPETPEREKEWWRLFGRELSGGIKYSQTASVAKSLTRLEEFGVDLRRLSFD